MWPQVTSSFHGEQPLLPAHPGLPFSLAACLIPPLGQCTVDTYPTPVPALHSFLCREWQLCPVISSVQNLNPSILSSHIQLTAEPAASAFKTWQRTSDASPITVTYITTLSLKGYCMAFHPMFRTTLKVRSDLISLLLRSPLASSASPELVHRDLCN